VVNLLDHDSEKPDMVARMVGVNTTNHPDAFYGGDISGSGISVTISNAADRQFNLMPGAKLTPGAANLGGEFAISNIFVGGNCVLVPVGLGRSDARYDVYTVDDDIDAPKTLVFSATNPPVGNFVYCDSNAILNAGVTSRFYIVVEVASSGAAVTNDLVWAVVKQERRTNRWHAVGRPVEYPFADDYGLHGRLGDELGYGLSGGSSFVNSPQLYIWDYNRSPAFFTNVFFHSSGEWCTADGVTASNTIDLGLAYYIKMATNGPAMTNSVFLGHAPLTSSDVKFTTNSWILFSWPFADTQFETEAPVGWGFAERGGHVGTKWEDSDRMFITYDNSVSLVYLGPGGRWYARGSTSVIPATALENGRAYYYYAHGTSFNWRAIEAP
jgi:hypothetical protein